MGTRVTRTFDMCPCKRATGPGRPPSKVDIYPVSRGRFHRQKTSRDPWCRFSFPSRSLFFFFSFFFCSIVILPPFVSRSACTCLPGRLLACLLARAIRVRSCFSFFSLSLSLSLPLQPQSWPGPLFRAVPPVCWSRGPARGPVQIIKILERAG